MSDGNILDKSVRPGDGQPPSGGDVAVAEEEPGSNRLELIAAVILGLAGLATAWGAYQAGVLGGDAVDAYAKANALQSQAADQFGAGDAQSGYDQQVFLQYAVLFEQGDTEMSDYIRQELMGPELAEAMDWYDETTDEVTSPFQEAEGNPYTIPGYEAGEELQAESEAEFGRANDANDKGDKYDQAGVLLAMALFFAGIGTLLDRRGIQIAILGAGAVLTVVGTVQLFMAGT